MRSNHSLLAKSRWVNGSPCNGTSGEKPQLHPVVWSRKFCSDISNFPLSCLWRNILSSKSHILIACFLVLVYRATGVLPTLNPVIVNQFEGVRFNSKPGKCKVLVSENQRSNNACSRVLLLVNDSIFKKWSKPLLIKNWRVTLGDRRKKIMPSPLNFTPLYLTSTEREIMQKHSIYS